jgi:hypothetical protein
MLVSGPRELATHASIAVAETVLCRWPASPLRLCLNRGALGGWARATYFVALQYQAPPRWLRISIANGGLARRFFWYLDW